MTDTHVNFLTIWAETPYARRLLGWLSRHVQIDEPSYEDGVLTPAVEAPEWLFNVLRGQIDRTLQAYETTPGLARWYWMAVTLELSAAESNLSRAVYGDR